MRKKKEKVKSGANSRASLAPAALGTGATGRTGVAESPLCQVQHVPTSCLSVAARVFIYPPALRLGRSFCSSQGNPQLLRGSGEDPRTTATAKPPSLTQRGAATRMRSSKGEGIQAPSAGSENRGKNKNIRYTQNCKETGRKFGIEKRESGKSVKKKGFVFPEVQKIR